MQELIFDIEANGLNPDRLHCLSTQFSTLFKDYHNFCETDNTKIGHNIYRYDIPVLEELVQPVKGRLIDTLFLSWYLFPNRRKHGLEEWGEDLGFPKVQITDWDNLSPQEYQERCERDVQITQKLWELQKKKLWELYGDDKKINKCINYLMFKAKSAALAEKCKWKLDVPKVQENLKILLQEKDQKVQELKKEMPEVPKLAKRTQPKVLFKKNGDLSSHGERWFQLLRDSGLPEDFEGVVQEVIGYKEPNPNSHDQIKEWLFSLGWEPCTFKQNDKKVDVPQINKQGPGEEGVTESIKALRDKSSAIDSLNNLFVLSHRISILEGFLKNVDEEGWIKAEIQGLTNTLRFKHKVLVNLPSTDKMYGEYIRPCLIAPEGFELCGSDMSSLEDRTKQHYMHPFDPEYVREMQTPDFDPHLDIAVSAGLMSKEQADDYRNGISLEELKPIRHAAKTTNYSCTYGAYPAKIAKSAGIPLEEAKTLWEGYWERNHSISKIADSTGTKEITFNEEKEMWLWNPVAEMWYSLRHKKDIFSTLNQGTGSYAFDTWIGYVMQNMPILSGQFHDEGVWCVRKGNREKITEILLTAIQRTNNFLKLNRELEIGIDFGDNYGEIH